jgi:Coenzyme PQQ synthesis protein D (PqqD)
MQNSAKRARLPENVIMQTVGDEAVLLNLNTNQYFSLNPVGVRMVEVLTQNASTGQAFSSLLAEYAVDPDVLRDDLQELLGQLLSHGLIEMV